MEKLITKTFKMPKIFIQIIVEIERIQINIYVKDRVLTKLSSKREIHLEKIF